ncbi:hypothetical protein ANN_14615 [Periplaneta americana]|uniref:Uncharacterized protein n=1 Tax=Periplaneta americana TaxID=6978 RepID=A0ABQ8SXF4_PERAM|nr:hypothetical protein ANN_14615 [Periplaneta americana]
MAGLCEGGNEPASSLKAICKHRTPLEIVMEANVEQVGDLTDETGCRDDMLVQIITSDDSCVHHSSQTQTVYQGSNQVANDRLVQRCRYIASAVSLFCL